MIKSIKLTNFFSFHTNKVELDKLNVLIGINGSGKSNFLKAFHVLKVLAVEGGLQDLFINRWGGFDAVCYAGNLDTGKTPAISITYEFDPAVLSAYGYMFTEPVLYHIKFTKVPSTQNYMISEWLKTKSGYCYFDMHRGKGYVMEGASNDLHKVNYNLDGGEDSVFSKVVDKNRYVQVFAIREALKSVATYFYLNTSESSPIRRPVMPSLAVRLLPDGGNLPQLLNKIKMNDRQAYKNIQKALMSVNPNYSDVGFNLLGSNIELMLEEEKLSRSIHVTHISDGTLRFLCILSIIYNSQRGSLVCIDEPETGLHPDMIAEMMDGLQAGCAGTQFIISTHSENVLNQVSVKDVMAFEKDEENASVVATFTQAEFQEWASSYATGRLWRNGDLGGNRY